MPIATLFSPGGKSITDKKHTDAVEENLDSKLKQMAADNPDTVVKVDDTLNQEKSATDKKHTDSVKENLYSELNNWHEDYSDPLTLPPSPLLLPSQRLKITLTP